MLSHKSQNLIANCSKSSPNGYKLPNFAALVGDVTFESSVGGVILEHIDHVVEGNEGIIDSNNLSSLGNGRSQNQATDTAESVDSNLKKKEKSYSCWMNKLFVPGR